MRHHAVTAYTTTVVIIFLLLAHASAAATERRGGLSPADEKAIRATIEAYRAAWLTNDAKGVLNTFTSDAVVLPAHGAPAVVGINEIEKYWFTPGGPATTITKLDVTVDQISGNGTLAFARGLDTVAWSITHNGVTRRHSHSGTYLNVMDKFDGTWRIKVRMWDDGPESVE